VTKVNPEVVTCFGAHDGGSIGAVSKYSGVDFFAIPQHRIHLEVDHVKPEVHIIKMVQGGSDLLFRACLQAKVDGIVVEASGGGNVNRPYYEGVCATLDAGIPVVASLRLVSGAPHAGKGYPGSFQSLVAKEAIPSGYLSGLKARLLLMVALARTQDRAALLDIFRRAGGG
jgi:L-asparaginase